MEILKKNGIIMSYEQPVNRGCERGVFMKNLSKALGLVIIAAAMALGYAACGNVTSAEKIIYSVTATEGQLTITGLNNYAGKYVFANAGNWVDDDTPYADLLIAENINEYGLITLGKVKSDGSVTLKVWEETSQDEYDYKKLENYKGNDSFYFYIYILDRQSVNIETFNNAIRNKDPEKEENLSALYASIGFSAMLWAEESFISGQGTISSEEWELIAGVDHFIYTVNDTDGQLTITGLSNYIGKYVFANASSYVDEDTPYTKLLIAKDADASGLITLGKVKSDGSITLKVWTKTGSEPALLGDYSGNDKVDFYIYILNGKTINIEDFNKAMEELDIEEEADLSELNRSMGFSAMLYAEESFIAGQCTINPEKWELVAGIDNFYYSINDTDTSGWLTITGLPEAYIGMFIFGAAGNDYTDLLITEDVDATGLLTLGEIDSGGVVKLKVWKETGSSPAILNSYSGSEKIDLYLFVLNGNKVNKETFAGDGEDSYITMLYASEKSFVSGTCTIGPRDWIDTEKEDNPWYTVNTATRELTITGLPAAFNNRYVFATASNDDTDLLIAGSVDYTGQVTLGTIKNGSVTLNVWKKDEPGNVILDNYSGNDSFDFFIYILLDKENIDNENFKKNSEPGFITMLYAPDAQFSGTTTPLTIGSNKWWDTVREAPWYTVYPATRKLTITNLPGVYKNKYVFATAYNDNDTDLLIAGSVEENGSVHLVQIDNNGSVTLNVWEKTEISNVTLNNYSGNELFDFDIYIIDGTTIDNENFKITDSRYITTLYAPDAQFSGTTTPLTIGSNKWWDTIREEDEPWYTVNTTDGRLTIIGLDAYKGKYVFASPDNFDESKPSTPYIDLLIAEAVNDEGIITPGTINNSGVVVLNVWQETQPNNIILDDYSGNELFEFYIYILSISSIDRKTFTGDPKPGFITMLYAEKSFTVGQCTLDPGEWEELH